METYQVFEMIDWLQANHILEILLAAGVLFILVDYFFPTDLPAHFGYLSLALGTFFIAYRASIAPVWCIVICLVSWAILGILHRLVFFKFLSNAPGLNPVSTAAEQEANPEATG